MAFEDDDKDLDQIAKKRTVNASSQKSIFDNKPKKPSLDEFHAGAKQANDALNSYRSEAADLGAKFRDMFYDKTLSENKTVISKDFEREVILKMLELSEKVNNDDNEPEGAGSLAWIALLFRMTLNTRDRMNKLEFNQEFLSKKIDKTNENLKELTEKLSGLDTAKKDG